MKSHACAVALLALWFGCTGNVGSSGTQNGATANTGGVGGSGSGASGPSGGGGNGGTSIPTEGACAWELGDHPTAEEPPEHTNSYVLDLAQWNISNTAGDPVQTRHAMNEAIAWAKGQGHNRVVVPAGEYLVGENTTSNYSAGIDLVGDMTLDLSRGAVIRMAPNDRHNYCVINVDGNSDVRIVGGTIVGDRDEHTYAGNTAHDEGHGVCAWTSVNRVLIEGVEMRELTGDGVLIVGRRATDDTAEEPSRNVTIRNCHIHHNRRQGVSVVGGHNVVIQDNHIHHIQGTSPQFGVDVEGAGRTDENILIYRNNFHHNAGGDVVTSTGRNLWIEENTMSQCRVDDTGQYDPSLPCALDAQVDGPIVHWKNTDNVIVNNTIRMDLRTVNGLWGIIGYTNNDGPARDNPVGNYIAHNHLHNCGIHMASNALYVVDENTIEEGLILGYRLACTRLTENRINRTASEHYKLRDVAGVATGNILNREDGAPASADQLRHFPMADDAPYRNSSPVFW